MDHHSTATADDDWKSYCDFARNRPRSDDGKFVVVIDKQVFGPGAEYKAVRDEASRAFPGRSALVMQLGEHSTELTVVRASRY